MKYLSSYKEIGLYSKKEFIFDNTITNFFKYLLPLYLFILFYSIYKYAKNIKIKYLIIIFISAFLLADLNSAIFHCYFSDRSFLKNEIIIEDDYLIINTNSGYSSNHHMFPSNWKDISDLTIISSIMTFTTPLLILTLLFIKSNELGLILALNFGMIILMPIIHKYCHEKHHQRYVPPLLDLLYNCKIILQPEKHSKHHLENIYNWSIVNGISDFILNNFIKIKCHLFDICPDEEVLKNCKKYLEIYNTDIVRIKFVGDINGKLNVKLNGNLFYEA
jgi:hypothetical protein